jgi:hypothetical protein
MNVLQYSKGILELDKKYKSTPFNQIELDALANAGVYERKTDDLSVLTLNLITKITEIIHGEVQYDDGVYFVKKDTGELVEFALDADGFNKFGLLWKLLRNGLLESGSILFWDEPEASINPELIPTLVDILLELQRGGVQVFVATHSDLLANEFSISRKDSDELKFFSLYHNDNGNIAADTDIRFDKLSPNPLTQASVEQYEREIEWGFSDNE